MYFLKALVVTALVASSSAAAILLNEHNAQCNSARIEAVAALDDARASIAKIKDASVANAAKAGITQVNKGIGQIGRTVTALQAPSDVGHGTVEAGIKATTEALEKGDTSDAAVVAAKASIERAKQAGKAALAKC